MTIFPSLQKRSLKDQAKSANGGHSLIDLQNIDKFYKTAVGDFPALKHISLQINSSEFVSIIGKSGSGKSTLLNMITGSTASSKDLANVGCPPTMPRPWETCSGTKDAC